MTGRDLIAASLRLIGSLAPGESQNASEATDGLATLNRMLDSWSTEQLLIFAYTPETALTLTPGTAAYTLGLAGSITTRPMQIEKALIRNVAASPAIEFPVNPLTLAEWTAIVAKDTQAEYPTDFFDDGGYPQRTLKLYPVPSVAHRLVLYTLRALTQIATIDTVISLPPGYEKALVFNLALDLAPEYGKSVPDVVMLGATESKAAIKRANSRPSYLRCDAVPAGSGRGAYDVMTGGSSR